MSLNFNEAYFRSKWNETPASVLVDTPEISLGESAEVASSSAENLEYAAQYDRFLEDSQVAGPLEDELLEGLLTATVEHVVSSEGNLEGDQLETQPPPAVVEIPSSEGNLERDSSTPPDIQGEIPRLLVLLQPVLAANYIDGRFVAIFDHMASCNPTQHFPKPTLLSRALNVLIRAQIQFGNGFFMSYTMLRKEMLDEGCKNTIHKIIKILQKIPGITRWIGTSGKRLRVSKFIIDIEKIQQWLRDHNQGDSISNFPVALKPRVKRLTTSLKAHVGQAPPTPVGVLEVHELVASSDAWKYLIQQFPTKITVEFADWLLSKIRERGMQVLDAFMVCMKKSVAVRKVSDPFAYLVSCYQAGSDGIRVALETPPSKTVLTLPPDFKVGAFWQIENKVFEILEVGDIFSLLENTENSRVDSFHLQTILKGHLKE